MMLWKLLREFPRDQFRTTVVSLGAVGRPAELLRGAGIEVVELGLPDWRKLVALPINAYRLLRRIRPDVIHGWMYHGNVAAWMLCAMTGFRTRLFWSIRQSLYDLGKEKRLTRIVIRAGVLASRTPEHITYVSQISRQQHEALGFCSSRACVIPNGFDLPTVDTDVDRRALRRARWGLDGSDLLVGHLARYHPMKDQLNLMRAAGEVVRTRSNVRFALAGPGLDAANRTLAHAILKHGLNGKILLLGETDDSAGFLSACDMFCLSSWAEGFPNALGEAMVCGLPAVVTRVGECEEIVGDCGLVVEPRDSHALAGALLQLVDLGPAARADMGRLARMRICENYSLATVAARYQSLYLRPLLRETSLSAGNSTNDRVTRER